MFLAVLSFLVFGCISFAVTLKLTFRSRWAARFAVFEASRSARLQEIGRCATDREFAEMKNAATGASVQSHIEALQPLRNSAPTELRPAIDLRIAADHAMLARLHSQANDAAAASEDRRHAAALLKTLGWKDVSDTVLGQLADSPLRRDRK